MRKNVFGRKLKRDKNQRQALFKGLMSSLVLYGKISTTEAKAKAIKGEVDKLFTKARKEERLARRLLSSHLAAGALDKFLLDVVPSFKNRNSGFTKTARLGKRLKDNSPLILMTWTDEVTAKKVVKVKKVTAKKEISAPKKQEKKVIKKEVLKKPVKKAVSKK